MAKYLKTFSSLSYTNITHCDEFLVYGKKPYLDPTMGSIYPFGYSGEAAKFIINGMNESLSELPSCRVARGFKSPLIEEMGDFLCKDTEFVGYTFSVSGTDGVECAIGIADLATSKKGNKIISLTPTWHGSSYLTRSLSLNKVFKHDSQRVVNVNHSDEETTISLIEKSFLTHDPSIFISVPFSYFSFKTWSDDFWKKLRFLCDRHNVIHINDDVFSCWGKHGTYHGYKGLSAEIKPDITVLGKGITGGFSPMSAVLCNQKVYDGCEGHSSGGHSHTPNMGGLGAMKATIQLIEEHKLFQRVSIIEAKLKEFGDKLISEGYVESYHGNGLCWSYNLPDNAVKADNGGLSHNINKNFGLVATLIANDRYFDLLEEKFRNDVRIIQ